MSPPRGCTNLKLRRLSRTVARGYDADMRPLGLTGAGELVSILGTVIGFYFGARGGESANGLHAQRADIRHGGLAVGE
jgi:hypothetical protein